jgi:hypothetical protein
MRILIILAGAIICIATPVQAQTYDPNYPVCMKVYDGHFGGGEWINCSYTSLPQCQASASGRAAMCVINPYFRYGQMSSPRAYRRYYPTY